MSFLSRLLGLGARETSEGDADSAEGAEAREYKGCVIVAAPRSEEGQWRVAGTIEKEVDGRLARRSFVRADLCMSREEAIEVSRRKAQQIVDQNPRLFDHPEDSAPV